MTTGQTLALSEEWKQRLGLSARRSPELYEAGDRVVDVPHAPAIRAALEELGLSAVFCVQGVPTVAILSVESYDRQGVIDLYGALWNQGLASLLLVIDQRMLRVFSLARTPLEEPEASFEARCLIEALEGTAEALRFRNFIYGAESGRLWRDYSEYFKPKERIDQVLLDNLKASHSFLCETGLSSDAAQALLIQAMFMAYLEDRQIITEAYFQAVAGPEISSLAQLLEKGDVKLLRSLFQTLRDDFNGDLFVAPCSFEPQAKAPSINKQHLAILARFRSGHEEMARGGQQRFWGYDFRFIPIELVSAVYDRFLGEREEERRAKGAYYTPMFLADTVVSQVWELLSPEVKVSGKFLDPACGSGVFLVRSFQRLCEHWRLLHDDRTIPWNKLRTLLYQVHGWDLNGSAVRVAVFSLYVALLEEVSPRDIRKLISRGKLLPELWGKTLVCRDFFEASDQENDFNVIIGNPPWTSRRGSQRPSVQWSKRLRRPMPGGEDAWAFSWKALCHARKDGVIAFLLPAMGFLHNHASNTVQARHRFFRECAVRRIINFADLRFQLFENAHRPTAMIIYGSGDGAFPYTFDYWAPKADLNLRIKRVITLSNADKLRLDVTTVLENDLVFKQRLWMREPDAKLFGYLSRLPRLGELVVEYGSLRRRRQETDGRWVIGQGYQPYGVYESEAPTRLRSEYVGTLPDLPIGAFQRISQPVQDLRPATSPEVRRKGFEAGFTGTRILIPRGVDTANSRLRASYCTASLTFQDILQAIVVPKGEERKAKLLTALLNSRVAIWFAFHGTASFGSDRPEVKQADLLRLPFPAPEDMPEPERAAKAATELIAIVEGAQARDKRDFELEVEQPNLVEKIDQLSYDYFCLSPDEVAIIEDTVCSIMPALQPHEGHFPALWREPEEDDRRRYAVALTGSLKDWFRDADISARLEAYTADLAILRLCLGSSDHYSEATDESLADVLAKLSSFIHQPLDGNFQLMPDMRVFVEKNLFLIKPMQMRFWLRSTALADADSIALDLDQILESRKLQGSHA